MNSRQIDSFPPPLPEKDEPITPQRSPLIRSRSFEHPGHGRSALRDRLEISEQRILQLEMQRTKAEKRLSASKAAYEQLMSHNDELRDRCARADDQLVLAHSVEQELTACCKKLENRCSKVEKERDGLHGQIASRERAFRSRMGVNYEDVEKDIQLREQVIELQNSEARYQSHVKSLEERNRGLSTLVDDLENKLTESSLNFEQLRVRLNECQKSNADEIARRDLDLHAMAKELKRLRASHQKEQELFKIHQINKQREEETSRLKMVNDLQREMKRYREITDSFEATQRNLIEKLFEHTAATQNALDQNAHHHAELQLSLQARLSQYESASPDKAADQVSEATTVNGSLVRSVSTKQTSSNGRFKRSNQTQLTRSSRVSL